MGSTPAFLLALLLLMLASSSSHTFHPSPDDSSCERQPPDVTRGHPRLSGDNGFSILISGNPKKYVPGEAYTVTLKNLNVDKMSRFIAFTLTVESSTPGKEGTFEILDRSVSQFAADCSITVHHTSLSLKSEVSVRWRAPITGSGCVRFRALVVEQRTNWYADDDRLTRDLCEEDFDVTEEIDGGCQACSEAKYEVVFEGLWSRHTHPKDFPSAEASFSDIIGASHSNMYIMWESGETANERLEHLAKDGDTSYLESHLVNNSKLIRTIIKARGLKHTNMKTFAVFRVDQEHHLLSLISKIIPSPDWFLGVNSVELCQGDGTWAEQVVRDLEPWDAGIDNSVTYKERSLLSKNEFEKIRRITPSFPNNPNSPFFDASGQTVKPLARLIITKKRQYDMPCTEATFAEENSRPECDTTEWTQFTPCSVTCGEGYRVRKRYYSFGPAIGLNCNKVLTQRERCEIVCDDFDGGSYGDPFNTKPTRVPRCAISAWSPWSPCSVSCGKGSRHRTRNYLNRAVEKVCTLNTRDSEECLSNGPSCFDYTELNQPCAVTSWTIWSPCTVTCGKGTKFRTRSYINPNEELKCSVQTLEKQACAAEKADCHVPPEEAQRICKMDRVLGPCRGYFPRWYFDVTRKMCLQFIYGGCRGNQNNFESYEDCNQMCRILREDKPMLPSVRSLPEKVVDCYVTEWGTWSHCSQTCGKGHLERHRTIKVYPQNGGKECPKKVIQRKKCTLRPCSS